MWNGKLKAITFSFDDGVSQDKRLIDILNKYNLKATFNINSSLLGLKGELECGGKVVSHCKVFPSQVPEIYKGHEVAVHTLTHPLLTREDDQTVIWQVEEDRKALSRLVGYEVQGMAYPCGGQNTDDRVTQIIKENTGVKYSRTITSTHNFELQENLYRFNPTVFYGDVKSLFSLGEEFLKLNPAEPKLFYIWGHSYELDAGIITWEEFENFCKMISNKKDVFYGTNHEVFFK